MRSTVAKVLLFALFALLPFWVGIALVVAGAVSGDRQGYEAAWYFLMFSLLACPVSLLLTTVAVVAYRVTAGGPPRKTAVAAAWLALLGALGAFAGVQHRAQRQQAKAYNVSDEARALALVKANDAGRRAAGGTPGYRVLPIYSERGGRYVRYTVIIEGDARLYGVVRADPSTNPSRLTLACITPMTASRSQRSDECDQADTRLRALLVARDHEPARTFAGGNPVFELVNEGARGGASAGAGAGAGDYIVEVQGARRAYVVVRGATPTALAVACITTRFLRHGSLAEDPCLGAEAEHLALEAVRASAAVRQATGPDAPLNLWTATWPTAGGIVQRVVQSRGRFDLYAIVRIDPATDPPTATVACLTAMRPDPKVAYDDICRRLDSIAPFDADGQPAGRP